MDNCGMQTNKKQESTGTDIDRRGDVGREGGGCEGRRYRVSKHVKVEGAKGGLGERWSRTEKMTMKREDKRMRK